WESSETALDAAAVLPDQRHRVRGTAFPRATELEGPFLSRPNRLDPALAFIALEPASDNAKPAPVRNRELVLRGSDAPEDPIDARDQSGNCHDHANHQRRSQGGPSRADAEPASYCRAIRCASRITTSSESRPYRCVVSIDA